MNRWRVGVAVLAMVLLAACTDDPTGIVRVDRVDVGPANQVLVVGDSTTITAVPRAVSGEVVAGVVLWRSLSPSVATVRVSGSTAVVEAKGAGVARIEAESGGRMGFVNVTVSAAPQVAVVTLRPAALVLEMGQEATIQAVAEMAGGEVAVAEADAEEAGAIDAPASVTASLCSAVRYCCAPARSLTACASRRTRPASVASPT